MAHFHFHKNGGPFPGTCIRCGNNKELWQLGNIPASNMAALLCDRCLTELAVFAGFVTGKSYAELSAAKTEIIDKQKAQLDATPKLLEKFTHDITGIIGDFITGLASISIPNKPVQPESDQADTGVAEGNAEAKPASGGSKNKNSKPSADSSID